jgi:hypothetical protein
MKYFTLILSLALFAQAASAIPEKAENFQLFLLAGQSNMAGRGKLDDAGKKPVRRVFALNKKMEWQPAVDPLHWDKSAAGVGIGKTFAAIVAEKNPGDSIGLIPAAAGGSPISTWVPGAYHDQTKSHPYDDALKRAKLAMEKGTLKAILWHQGESDSNKHSAASYEKRLGELINRFRTDLGQPELPFIIGQLGVFPGKESNPNRDTVNNAFESLSKKMDHVAYVSSEGFTSHDGLHFDTKSVRIFAERYAAAYLEMTRVKP